jgi:mono/diheme cytochrome c family protein
MRRAELVLGAVLLCVSAQSVLAQRGKPAAAVGFPDGPGKEVLLEKCFQCHTPGMWMDQRQDRRAWESTLYRMIGRGALRTEAEINAMAAFLAQTRGPK